MNERKRPLQGFSGPPKLCLAGLFYNIRVLQERKELRRKKCVDPKIVARKVAWKERIFFGTF